MAFAGGAFVQEPAEPLRFFPRSVFPNNFDLPQLVFIYCMVIPGGLVILLASVMGAILPLHPPGF